MIRATIHTLENMTENKIQINTKIGKITKKKYIVLNNKKDKTDERYM